MDLLNLLLDQEKYLKDVKYPSRLHRSLITFAVNIILVLEGGRLAYLPYLYEKNVQDQLIQLVLENEPNLMLVQYKHHPLIILKENHEIVVDILSNESNNQTALAKVLGYPYAGLEWTSEYRDVYIISYDLSDNIPIYCFVIPVEEYNDKMRVKILEDTIKYQNILSKYGYQVILNSKFKAKDSKSAIPISFP